MRIFGWNSGVQTSEIIKGYQSNQRLKRIWHHAAVCWLNTPKKRDRWTASNMSSISGHMLRMHKPVFFGMKWHRHDCNSHNYNKNLPPRVLKPHWVSGDEIQKVLDMYILQSIPGKTWNSLGVFKPSSYGFLSAGITSVGVKTMKYIGRLWKPNVWDWLWGKCQ